MSVNIVPINARCVRCHTLVNKWIADLFIDWGINERVVNHYHPDLYMICKNVECCRERQRKNAADAHTRLSEEIENAKS